MGCRRTGRGGARGGVSSPTRDGRALDKREKMCGAAVGGRIWLKPRAPRAAQGGRGLRAAGRGGGGAEAQPGGQQGAEWLGGGGGQWHRGGRGPAGPPAARQPGQAHSPRLTLLLIPENRGNEA